MTKRVILSVILLLLALSLSVSSYFLLQKQFVSLGEALEDAVYADVSPERSGEKIALQWKKSTKIFHIFLIHSDLSDLQTEIESLPDLTNDAERYRMSCIRCLHLLDGVRESVSLSFENIL